MTLIKPNTHHHTLVSLDVITASSQADGFLFSFRYRHWKLGEDIDLIVRCEHDGVMTGANGEVSFINVKTLNEWDSRVRGSLRGNWIQSWLITSPEKHDLKCFICSNVFISRSQKCLFLKLNIPCGPQSCPSFSLFPQEGVMTSANRDSK